MGLILAKDLNLHSYILSSKRAFFHRYCDTGFKNKWCGLWAMPYKFLEYFAFKINDKWLGPEKCKSFNQTEFSASHHFDLDEFSVNEVLFLPDVNKTLVCFLTIKNLSNEKKKLDVGLEVAVNIREREENWNEREYNTTVINDANIVNSDKGFLIFGSLPRGKLNIEPYYKEHYPSDEKQRCFIPGEYKINIEIEPGKEECLTFVFSCGADKTEAMRNYENMDRYSNSNYMKEQNNYVELLSNAYIKSNIDFIDQLFVSNIISLEKLSFESSFGLGYFAGYPWFTQFWGRDLCWIIPAIVDCGQFDAARESLRTLSKLQSDGCIPNIIFPNGNVEYNSIDATPLWIIALQNYIINSGDINFLNSMKEHLLKAIEWCKKNDIDNDGFLEHEGKMTWMDTLERTNKAIEIQAFWIIALRSAGNLLKILGDVEKGKGLEKEANVLEQKFEKLYWNNKKNFYFDSIPGEYNNIKTVNPIFPLFFGISSNPEMILKVLESDEFTSPFGVRTISKNEHLYVPNSYHNGSSWGWITALMACGEFKNNRIEKGMEYLRILFENLNQQCIGAIGEAWNSENNDTQLQKEFIYEPGACLQGWSSALVIRCIDEFMLGIQVDAFNNTITVSPTLPKGAKIVRKKRIGNDLVDITIERKRDGLNISYKSKNNREYRLIVPPKV